MRDIGSSVWCFQTRDKSIIDYFKCDYKIDMNKDSFSS